MPLFSYKSDVESRKSSAQLSEMSDMDLCRTFSPDGAFYTETVEMIGFHC